MSCAILHLPQAISTRWQHFTFLLEKRGIPSLIPESKLQAEEAISHLGDILRNVFEQCSHPVKNANNNLKLPEDIRQIITERNRARRMWQVHITQYFRTLFNQLNRKVQAVIY